jgi:hypothetical protein
MSDAHDTRNDQAAGALADAVVRRERRRVRWLAGVTVGLWLLAALTIPAFFLPLRAKVDYELSALMPNNNVRAEQLSQIVVSLFRSTMFAAGWVVAVTIATALLASAATIALALSIRRLTLRQVTEQLALISAQLSELRRQP